MLSNKWGKQYLVVRAKELSELQKQIRKYDLFCIRVQPKMNFK